MRDNLKNDIIKTARSLFGERGYNDVSMRNIADALDISVGNLTYHYKRKEDLIEAAVIEQHKNYHKPLCPKTLEELNQLFYTSLKHQRENAYYFRHYTQLAQLSPRVYHIQLNVMRDFIEVLEQAFKNFRQDGVFQPPQLPEQYRNLAVAIRTIIHFGHPKLPDEINDSKRLAYIWSLLYPMLTAKGKEIYHTKVENAFN